VCHLRIAGATPARQSCPTRFGMAESHSFRNGGFGSDCFGKAVTQNERYLPVLVELDHGVPPQSCRYLCPGFAHPRTLCCRRSFTVSNRFSVINHADSPYALTDQAEKYPGVEVDINEPSPDNGKPSRPRAPMLSLLSQLLAESGLPEACTTHVCCLPASGLAIAASAAGIEDQAIRPARQAFEIRDQPRLSD